MPRSKPKAASATAKPAKAPPRSRLIRGDVPAKPVPKAPKPVKTTRLRSLCPINLVLEAVGDSWSMLIIRDMMLRGHSSYQAFLRSEEKIATNILADRLTRLEQNGLITKAADPGDARKFIYSLTQKGADLAPLLVEMTLYSLKHETRVDMPKEVVADMQKNKQAFSARLIRHSAPRVRGRAATPAISDPVEETLSLF